MTKLFGKKGLTILFMCFMLCGVMAATGYAQSEVCYRCVSGGVWATDCSAYGGNSTTTAPYSYVKRDGTACGDKCSNVDSVCYNNLRSLCNPATVDTITYYWHSVCTNGVDTTTVFKCEPFASFTSDWVSCDISTPYCACDNWNGETDSGNNNWTGTSIPAAGACGCSSVPYEG